MFLIKIFHFCYQVSPFFHIDVWFWIFFSLPHPTLSYVYQTYYPEENTYHQVSALMEHWDWTSNIKELELIGILYFQSRTNSKRKMNQKLRIQLRFFL